MQYEHPLILTGSVLAHAPVRRADSALRLADYRAALFLWITASPFDLIVYLDASNYCGVATSDHLALADLHGKTVLTRTFDLREISRTVGKGRAEAYMVRMTMAEFGWEKVTKSNGRLYICNCQSLDTAPGDVSFFKSNAPITRVDTRYYRVSQNFFEDVLAPVEEEIDDSNSNFFIEKVWGRAIGADRRVSWWSEQPRIFGVNAT